MSSGSVTAPLHTYSAADLEAKPVSETSLWSDNVWRLSNPTPGASMQASKINWAIPLCDDKQLTDDDWSPLLDAFKRLVWSLYTDRQAGQVLQPGTLTQLAVGIRSLARWMSEAGYKDFACLTPTTINNFIEWLLEQTIEVQGKSHITTARLEKPLTVILYIWQQSDILRNCGLSTPASNPLAGHSARQMAEYVSRKKDGRIPPIPDRFALPVMHTALFYITLPADDIIELQEKYLLARERRIDAVTVSASRRRSGQVIEDYHFSKNPVTGESWREPIATTYRRTLRQESSQRDPAIELRSLILDVSAAAQIILQSCVGLRGSELCAIQSGWNGDLPSCVSTENTPDGLMEIFYLHSKVSKGRPAPEPAQWVIGSRPSGSTHMPPTVRALIVLQRLYDPWRRLGNREDLICSLSTPHGLPNQTGSIGPAYVEKLAYWQKSFIAFSVKFDSRETLTPSSHIEPSEIDDFIASFRPHQWRKTFAQYLFRVSSKLLRALSRHFKHMNIAITERGYIGTSSEFITDIMSESHKIACDYLYNLASGKTRAAGPLARLVQEHIERIETEGESAEYAALQLYQEASTAGIRMSHGAHGKCFVSLFPTESKCHLVAGTTSWTAQEPNFATRSPSLCIGCKCFSTDPDHLDFWEGREKAYEKSLYDNAGDISLEAEHVMRQRLRQSQAVASAIRGRRSNG